MNKEKEPLYRRVNTKTRGASHSMGNARYDKGTKEGVSRSMKRGIERGLDYTPLYKFLLSKVGQNWDDVYREAVQRLDKVEPISYIVIDINDLGDHRYGVDGIIRGGESTYYSSLFVDENNILQKVKPDLKNEDLQPSCGCCTHTFNGKPFINKYNYEYCKDLIKKV